MAVFRAKAVLELLREMRQQLSRHFDFYNHRRLHQALDYCTRSGVYADWVQQTMFSSLNKATKMHPEKPLCLS